MEYVLKTNRLSKSYGHFKALNDLTMTVPKGAIYGFVGKNGAGKTTLIRLICGLQEPTSGDYSIYGVSHENKEIYKSRRRMGAVVETPSIYLDMTAVENLKMQYKNECISCKSDYNLYCIADDAGSMVYRWSCWNSDAWHLADGNIRVDGLYIHFHPDGCRNVRHLHTDLHDFYKQGCYSCILHIALLGNYTVRQHVL